MAKPYRFINQNGISCEFIVTGRNGWALNELILAGDKGITTMNNPAPRLSAYIFNLIKMGIQIDKKREKHEGEFAGTHVRYFLAKAHAFKPKPDPQLDFFDKLSTGKVTKKDASPPASDPMVKRFMRILNCAEPLAREVANMRRNGMV